VQHHLPPSKHTSAPQTSASGSLAAPPQTELRTFQIAIKNDPTTRINNRRLCLQGQLRTITRRFDKSRPVIINNPVYKSTIRSLKLIQLARQSCPTTIFLPEFCQTTPEFDIFFTQNL